MEKQQIDFSVPLGTQQFFIEMQKNSIAPVAKLLSEFVSVYDRGDADLAFREMIKLFVSVFKYSGLVTICDYLNVTKQDSFTDCNDVAEIDKFIYTNISGMSLGHWQWCLREITRWAREKKINLFVPGMIDLYWKRNGKPADVALWIDNKMIPLRNDFVHSDIWIDKETSRKLICEYLPSLAGYMNTMSFMNAYILKTDDHKSFYIVDNSGNRLDLNYLIIYSKKADWGREELLFYETLKGKSVKYLLGNLFNFENELKDQIKSIQLDIKKRMEQVSSVQNEHAGNDESKITQLFTELDTASQFASAAHEQLDSLQKADPAVVKLHDSVDNALARIKNSLEITDSIRNELSKKDDDAWDRCRTAAKLSIYRLMLREQGSLLASPDFDALYLERTEARSQYNLFLDNENTSLCFMLAESGSGKTNFCYRTVRDFLRKADQDTLQTDDIVVFLPGSSITSENPGAYLASMLGQPNSSVPEILQQLAPAASARKGRLIIIVDGLNENDAPAALTAFLADIAASFPYQWLKLFATCRVVMWSAAAKGVSFPKNRIYTPVSIQDASGDVPHIRLGHFDGADVKNAYGKYAINRFIRTPFDALPVFIKELCRDPFLLNLITDAFRGHAEAKSEIRSGSVQSIFERYLFQSVPKKLSRPTKEIPEPSDYIVVKRILELMWNSKRDYLTEDDLQSDSLLNEKIYEPPLAFAKGDVIICSDSICHWTWRPEERNDFPFNCPVCGNNTLLWKEDCDGDYLGCTNEGCSWQWRPDKSKAITFTCQNGHQLHWGAADQRTPYQRLCDEGILNEVVKDGDSFILKFRYDRIFEFLMASEHCVPPDLRSSLTGDQVISWCSDIGAAKNALPIFYEVIALAISMCDTCIDVCTSLLTPVIPQDPRLLPVIAGALRKRAVADSAGTQTVLPLIKMIVKSGNETAINAIVLPVVFALRRESVSILELLLFSKQADIRKKFSDALYRIFASHVDDGLWLLDCFLGRISVTSLFRYKAALPVFLEISLKLASMLPRDKSIDMLNMWVRLMQRILGVNRNNPLLSGMRSTLKFAAMKFGSGLVLGQFRKMVIGTTTLYDVLFKPSEYKKGMKHLSDFFIPLPGRLHEIKPVIADFMNVNIDSGKSDGKEMLGLLPIIVLNVQLRQDPLAELPVLNELFDTGGIYARWALCSAVNYSVQESYFESGNRKPLEKNQVVIDAYRGFMKRLLAENRDGIVRDSLITGDYFFPLGILVEFSYATDSSSELIYYIIDTALNSGDFLLMRKLLLDIMCFSLDTFCVQRRFWEKTLDIIPECIKRLFPVQEIYSSKFDCERDVLEQAVTEALAVFQYAHPDETEAMIEKLHNDYLQCPDTRTQEWIGGLNRSSREAMHLPFRVLRTNTISLDKKGNPEELRSIVDFIDRFLYGWIFADFVSVIFGRYPGFRNTAQYWIQETLAPEYEKKPSLFTKKLFSTVFDAIQTYESGSASFNQ